MAPEDRESDSGLWWRWWHWMGSWPRRPVGHSHLWEFAFLGQLQSWWEMFHPGTTACLFGPQRAGPQLAFLDPIPAAVPHCVCINSLQTAGWGDAQKAVPCWVLGHPAVSPTQKWSNPHQRMQHLHRLAVRVRVWILRSWASLWGPVVLPLPGSMTLDKLPSKPQFPYL